METFLSNISTQKIIALLMGIALVWGLNKLVQRKILVKIKETDNRYKAYKITTFIGYALVAIWLVVIYNDKLRGLSVALGVAGAGVAFALQEVIASLAGWLVLLFGRFYKIGDRVQLNGVKGDVMDIGFLRTTIMEIGQWIDGDTYNGRIVHVANSFVLKEPVYNYSTDFPFLWDEIKIPLMFGSNYKKAQELIQSLADRTVADNADASIAVWHELQYK